MEKIVKKILVGIIVFSIVFFKTNIRVNAEQTYSYDGCAGDEITVSFSSKIKQNLNVVCEENGNVGKLVSTSSVIFGAYASYSYGYKFEFSNAGTYTISAKDAGGNLLKVIKVKIASNHNYDLGKVKRKPACTEEGETEYTCLNCGKVKLEKVKELGHEYQIIGNKEATCETDGYTKYGCIRCKDNYIDTHKAVGHEYENPIIVNATCENDGKKEFVCRKCQHSYYETLPKLGHTYGEWVADKEATIFADGKDKRICDNCHHIEYRSVKKLLSSVRLTKQKINLRIGKKYNLKIAEKSKGDVILSWKSSKTSVVKVGKKSGKLSALKKGKAIVTLVMKSGCSAKCVVRVK